MLWLTTMMRLVSKTLLVAFALLTAVATASAESAWVLWLAPTTDNPPRWESSFRRKFPTLEDCDRHASLIFTEFNLMHPDAVLEARCLPDPVDQRGAKRK